MSLFLVFMLYFTAILAGFGTMNYLHALNEELPETEEPFNAFGLSSNILDRKGTELYRVSDEYYRNPLNLDDVPASVKWAFIAGEDLDFYSHFGFDPAALARCSLSLLDTSDSFCGGSTITQQLIKLTALGNEVTVERKLKEIMLSMKVEDAYLKDQILEQYLSIVPMGSNIYGISAGAEFYFGKQVKDLSLAQAAILASIIQDPIYSSPTLGLPDIETAQAQAKNRQLYVLDQIEKNLENINEQNRLIMNDVELDDVFTAEVVQAAREEELTYKSPVFTNKKAGHFVDYVQQLLLTRPYNNGENFTAAEIALGGYTIYTTLDYDMQKLAEQTVKQAAESAESTYKGYNAAMLTLQPNSGEVLVMVGSKDYAGSSERCSKTRGCKFTPQVNIMTTKQSPGSSTKPFGYYEAYRKGKLYTGSLLPDVPIDVGGGYDLKNWNGTFFGVSPKTTAAKMLCESRNLPAVTALETVGIPAYLATMKRFGYTTYNDSTDYGHSVILGGSDVYGIEHAQAYGVFANQGYFVQHEVIRKIVDRDGNVVFEHKPEARPIGDARAAYMLNYSLDNCFQASWDGRDVGAKTGTSQNNADAWTVIYSPDFVTVGWMGNNNNDPMTQNAFGVSAVMPWLKNYMKQVGETSYFKAKTPFKRPDGLKWDGGNTVSGRLYGLEKGFIYAERYPAIDGIVTTKLVCKDQQDRLARQVDIDAGMAMSKSFVYYRMPVTYWQRFLDGYLYNKSPNGGPRAYCTADR